MKREDDDLGELRSWLVEDTGSEAEADRLLPIVRKLREVAGLGVDTEAQSSLTNLLMQEHRASQPESRPERTVVCIDDDVSMIDLVGLVLRSRGYQVLGAISGPDGLQLVPKVKPDLVLLDIMMPDMDGWEVYQHMKSDEYMRSVPVIVVSAKAQTIDKVLGLNIAKVQDYITKPFSPTELVESVNKVLARIA